VKFGSAAVADSVGCVVAHSVRLEGLTLKKGEIVTPDHVAALARAGVSEIVVARLEAGDVPEDEAAAGLAKAIAGENVRVEAPFTGRSNLFAQTAGVLRIDAAAVDRVNAIHETLTLATLAPWKPVVAGEMIATVKVIPYAAPRKALEAAIAAARPGDVAVSPFTAKRVGVISTLLPGLKASVVAKTLRVMGERLAPMGAQIVFERSVPHDVAPLAGAVAEAAGLSDIVVVFGASAITDRRDVIPAAVVAAGGEIVHLGMPVDPGNLLLVSRLAGKPVLGAPGCARSPKENGFDWVLQRLCADIEVSADDVRRMGVGGLLMEIVARGQPREGGEGQDPDEDA